MQIRRSTSTYVTDPTVGNSATLTTSSGCATLAPH